jgi:tripeptidyl-peptidase I
MLSQLLVVLGLMLCMGQILAGFVQMEPSVKTFTASNWIKERVLGEKDMVKAVFALKHDSAAVQRFEADLLEIATPSNKKYGKWFSHDEIKARLAPSASSVKVVTDFLEANNVKDYKVSRLQDMIEVTMPATVANTMFNTEFAAFRSVLQRNLVIPRVTKPYHLPEEVAKVVNIVDDIMRFPSVRDSPKSYGYEESTSTDPEFSTCGTKCNGDTTPDVLRKRYNFDTVTSVANGNSMSVAEFQMQYYDNTDLKNFSGACGGTVVVDETIGGNNEAACSITGCTEALLDIEYIEAVANPIPLTVLYLSQFSLLDWVNQVLALPSPPLVHSVSYGNDEVQQTSVEYMQTVNEQFMQTTSLGLSILFAAGDQGVWGRSGKGATFHPDFPASSPYVTSVGGTDFATKGVIGEETTWSCGGGGFSDTFAMPSWQSAAVNNYLSLAKSKKVLPDAVYFNASGRAYPDVAALGGQVNPYCVSSRGGTFSGIAGTSASCPVVSGIFAQLNNVRLAGGKPSLGWLNPFIYSTGASCFNDVNDGSQNNCKALTTGFSALDGWDPATGFGTPNFQCLAKLM